MSILLLDSKVDRRLVYWKRARSSQRVSFKQNYPFQILCVSIRSDWDLPLCQKVCPAAIAIKDVTRAAVTR
eukprot:5280509-Amphidinium_carterae.1